ncbi:putative transposable element [Pseudoloma neurophilia]|uniref:Putative transposable element n=1 Tax=Pseudoloma neurophilia TaxID=146866 RepID=A0A0R0M270_9MICR|nr:putative transposable element [Pseudoloma neurophilia]
MIKKLLISGPGPYCRKAAYEELRIPSLALRGAKLRARAIAKWSSSRTTIGLLLRSPFKDRSATWMTGTQRWLKTLLHATPPTGVPEAVSAVVTAMTTRLGATDRSQISQFRRAHNLGCVIPLWKPVLRSPVKVAGMHMLSKIRVGMFFFAYRLAGAGIIDRRYLSECPCCGVAVREDAKHVFLTCRSWNEQRAQLLGDHISNLSNLQEDDLLGVLLGGESHVDANQRVQVTVASVTYLSLIVPFRARVIDTLVQ